MLHLIYLIVFTILSLLALSNLLRSLISLSFDSQRQLTPSSQSPYLQTTLRNTPAPHPELLDLSGNPINEPLLVMRSMSLEDARQQLDDLYHNSPSYNTDTEEFS
jgi:hypothetical protein